MLTRQCSINQLIQEVKEIISNNKTGRINRLHYRFTVIDITGERTTSSVIECEKFLNEFLQKMEDKAQQNPEEANALGACRNEIAELETVLVEQLNFLEGLTSMKILNSLTFFDEEGVCYSFNPEHIVRSEIRYFN